MKPEYILEKVEDKATLYHLKVKDSNNLMVETNLFFDLKKHSWAYNSFVISQSDDQYIHNFKGLIQLDFTARRAKQIKDITNKAIKDESSNG